jgi:hypothetical protein
MAGSWLAAAAVGALLAVSAHAAPSPAPRGVDASQAAPAQTGRATKDGGAARGVAERFGAPLICLWQHEPQVDVTGVVAQLGFNTVWTDDPEYTGQRWEETQMYRALQVPGIKYVIPKIDRAAWGWTQEGSLKTARWIAELSLKHKEIIGLYLNDLYDEIEEGHRTMEQWREIIAAAKSVNPKLDLWVPHYPHRGNEKRAYDFDYQAVVLNLWDPRNLADADKHLATARAQHAGKIIIGGLYINSGSRRGHWLTEQEFKDTLRLYVDYINAGKLDGLRIYCACQFVQRPEYVQWAKEVMGGLKGPGPE